MRLRVRVLTIFIIGIGLLLTASLNWRPASAAYVGVQVTGSPLRVVAPEQANVRSGPGTVYDEVGQLVNGDSAPAIGRSEFKDWIQIEYSAGPDGKGWVFAAFVSLEGGGVESLPVAPVPPTATLPPVELSTTAVAPLPTRLPTFTPGPTAAILNFENSTPGRGFPSALLIIGLLIVGVFGGVMAFVRRAA